jgi:ABC-type multidrug transport system fused ATPase/permease subunit
VDFRYPSRDEITVLNNVTISIQPGQEVALVGPSGAGKSTLVSLLLKFYEPTNGFILFDGRDSRSFPITSIRRQMAIVMQDVFLFGGTVRENIAYGKPGAGEQEIIDAAIQANAWDFIRSFPDKLNTVVGERGVQLSGGQRQRIAIARAVLKNPTILILDEATSSLDSESERLVQEALEKLMQGRTSVVIAHRLATVRKADKIIVLESGKIVEQGTHAELISNENGLYKTLTELQFSK